jgi:flagellar motility protein MotE (MotC chaperone)
MRSIALIATPLLFGLVATTALAQEDRYVLEKSDDGFVRMDRKSGEMSTCRTELTGLVCKLAADERTAYQDEIDRLQRSIAILEQRVGKLENSLTARLESKLPTEQEFDQTLGYMERFLRRFMGIVKDFEHEDKSVPGSGQRT